MPNSQRPAQDAIYIPPDGPGERLLVMRGEPFDGIVSCARWLTKLGDGMHDFTVMLSHSVKNLRRAMRRPYWPVADRVESCSALVEKHSA